MTTTCKAFATNLTSADADASDPAPSRLEGGRRVSRAAERLAPAITIVTVAYNGCEHLAESVDSVLAVHRDDVDYVIVDGGSTDGTVDFLRGRGDQLEYWLSEPDGGIYQAMNKAVGLIAPDSYVLFLGVGDRILRLPDTATIAAARVAGDEVLYGDVLVGDRLFRSSFDAKLNYRNTLHHQGLFIRKGCPPEPWFDESLRVFSDWDLNLDLFRRQVPARHLGFTVAYAEPGGISAKLHLAEIARMMAKRRGWIRALAALGYHGALHLLSRNASIPAGSRK
jgi:glycosyltransferase involved in cell wall biosynthesis